MAFTLEPMERLAQLVIVPVVQAQFNVVTPVRSHTAGEGEVRLHGQVLTLVRRLMTWCPGACSWFVRIRLRFDGSVTDYRWPCVSLRHHRALFKSAHGH